MDIKTKRSRYTIIKKLGLLVNSELKDDFSTIKVSEINPEAEILELRKKLTDKKIRGKLSECTALVLGITERCNFRCSYCVYSGSHKGERKHSEKKMNFETAKKAVDLFMKSLMQDTRKKKRRGVFIGFYGGEALLEFGLIKEIIGYVEDKAVKTGFHKRFEILFRLTTNGYLLSDEIADYFKEKDILIDLSIDGPEQEHDRFRVTGNGQKTWTRIINNLKRIKKRYPGYYENNISYQVTLHPHHNCKEIDRFFMENRDYFPEMKTRFNPVTIDRLSNDEKEHLEKTAGPQSELYLAQARRQNFSNKFKLITRQPGDWLTGTCFPGGEELFVSASGELNVCEKAGEECPKIGHIDTGFDFDEIRKMMKDYNEEIIRNRCWECGHWFSCSVCIANAYTGGRFEFNCSIKESYSPGLKQYLEKEEEEDEKKYSHYINRINNGIVDFIEQL